MLQPVGSLPPILQMIKFSNQWLEEQRHWNWLKPFSATQNWYYLKWNAINLCVVLSEITSAGPRSSAANFLLKIHLRLAFSSSFSTLIQFLLDRTGFWIIAQYKFLFLMWTGERESENSYVCYMHISNRFLISFINKWVLPQNITAWIFWYYEVL